MKAKLLTGSLLTALILLSDVSSRTPLSAQQKTSSPAKTTQDSAEKDATPFPQVPRITAEEVQRLAKEEGNVVLVDTDDPEAFAAEHIKGAVNIAYDPTVDPREQDQLLSALPGDRLVVFYCNCSHEEDSAPMVLEMWELGYDHDKVKALKGGLTRWEQLHYPLVGTDIDKDTQKGY